MDVKQAIKSRRAFRSLDPVDITDDLIKDLARSAQLSPSCFNHQPWRFLFVCGKKRIESLYPALSKGNEWARSASMIIVVFSRKQDDCVIKDREYHQFDCGIAVGFILLRATELGLIAHPIAGFSPKKTRQILHIPEDWKVITWIIVGKHSRTQSPVLSPKQIASERVRPKRKPIQDFAFMNRYPIKARL